MAESPLEEADPARLSELISVDSCGSRAWEPDELGAVLRHQLSAVVQFDLGDLDPGAAARFGLGPGPAVARRRPPPAVHAGKSGPQRRTGKAGRTVTDP